MTPLLERTAGKTSFSVTSLPSSSGEVPATVSVLDWDGDKYSDLAVVWRTPFNVANNSIVGYVFSGEDVNTNETPTPVLTITDEVSPLDSIAGPDRTSVLDNHFKDWALFELTPKVDASFGAGVIGDINGDGLEDLALVDTGFLVLPHDSFMFPNLARVYVMLGGSHTESQALNLVDLKADAFGLGYGVIELGDVGTPLHVQGTDPVTQDGYDDFALVRKIEDFIDTPLDRFPFKADASLLVFMGLAPETPEFKNELFGVNLDVEAEEQDHRVTPDLSIRRFSDDALLDDVFVVGELTAVAGDLNADGEIDLVVGEKERLLTTNISDDRAPIDILELDRRGRVYVLWSAASHIGNANANNTDLALTQADITIQGAGLNDRLGTFASVPMVDLGGDRFDDLLIGATGANGFTGQVVDDAGKLYVVYGSPQRVHPDDRPDIADVTVISNRSFTGSGDFLVDLGTGQPETRGETEDGRNQLTAASMAPQDGIVQPLAIFWLSINQNSTPTKVTLNATQTVGNAIEFDPVEALQADLDESLDAASLTGVIETDLQGSKLILRLVEKGSNTSLQVRNPNTMAQRWLGLRHGQLGLGTRAVSAQIVSVGPLPSNGELPTEAQFTLTIIGGPDDGRSVAVNLQPDPTNEDLNDLRAELQQALDDAFAAEGLVPMITAGNTEGRLTLTEAKIPDQSSFSFMVIDANAVTVDQLQFGVNERWFTFTTLGDGRAGNIIQVDPVLKPRQILTGDQDDRLRAVAGTLIPIGEGIYSLDPDRTELTVGGESEDDKIAILEFELSGVIGDYLEHYDEFEGAIPYFESILLPLTNVTGDGTLTAQLLVSEGDRLVTADDGQEEAATGIINFENNALDLTEAVRQFLQTGRSRITLRLAIDEGNGTEADDELTFDADALGLQITIAQRPGRFR